jgi:hypothetical protein
LPTQVKVPRGSKRDEPKPATAALRGLRERQADHRQMP